MNIAEVANLPERYGDDYPSLAHPVLDAIQAEHDIAKLGAVRAASRLVLCRDMGLYDPTALTRIMDFGAGHGGSTFAVALLAEEVGATVDAVEELPARADVLKSCGLTHSMPVQAHEADAVKWLTDRADDEERFDLITACMFGPDFRGKLAEELLTVLPDAVNIGGKLLIYSDPRTMAAAQKACDEGGVTYHAIPSTKSYAPPDAVDTIVVTNL